MYFNPKNPHPRDMIKSEIFTLSRIFPQVHVDIEVFFKVAIVML